ncbi:MAG: aminotransferase-like domain-containing protein [Alphaproteobacteria bacterium]
MPFDVVSAARNNLPAPAKPWKAFPEFNFVGGHNDGDSVPSKALADAITAALTREGSTLATYGLESGPQGYRPFRDAIAAMLRERTTMPATADQVLVTSGSLQALDLVFDLFLDAGDVVFIEEACYGGTMTRLAARNIEYVGIALDGEGMRADALAKAITATKAAGKKPKMIYTIPTVQNPTGAVMGEARRRKILAIAAEHDLPIFEDDCYADLIFAGGRPPALRALDTDGRVIYCGSFSKSIAPAIRVGYIVADWPIISRLLPLKTDAGSGAIEQMALAGYIGDHFASHVDALRQTLKGKADALANALAEHFGEAAEFDKPVSGIFLWVTLPETVDTTRLFQVAGAEGVAINPGVEWSTDDAYGRRRIRICFANPSIETIHAGVAKLADICHREFGVPMQSGNIQR